MGLGDLLKASENAQLKSQIAELQNQNSILQKKVDELQNLLTPEHLKLHSLTDAIRLKQDELDELDKTKQSTIQEMKDVATKLLGLKMQVVETDETILLQSFGLYEPQYSFSSSTQYKDRLDEIRAEQKAMVKKGTAVTGATDWTVNGNRTQGQKMVKDTQKLLLRAFNTECDELIGKIKFNNIESIEKRIRASREAISRLGTIMNIHISARYLDLKIEELHLAYEYAVKKQEEKENIKRIRAEQREQAKLEREIEAARRKLMKEQAHCENELARMLKQDTSTMTPDEKAAYDAKKMELEEQLSEVEKGIADVDYREANQKAGYVYVISNIGSFGENIYKIGMTRRLDPMERVDELGDASVPFKFDVHAMIFSDDAPALEAALHKAFEDRKVNMVNTRREFFNVTLEEIENVIKENFDKTVEFTEAAQAQQYRESELIRQSIAASKEVHA